MASIIDIKKKFRTFGWIGMSNILDCFIGNIKMEESITATSNVTTFTECVLELVSNSLKANATAIAIRIHGEERKLQIIDNGTGIHKKRLKTIAEYNSQKTCNCCNTQYTCSLKKKTLVNIRRLCDAMLITSRYHSSCKTYMKAFKVWCAPHIVKVQRRPSHGTTVSIYGFHELSLNKWNIPSMYHLVANVAIANVNVSFSIRDDQEKRVIMIVSKPHNPIQIIHVLYNREILFNKLWYIKDKKTSNIKFCAYIALARPNVTQYIFLNNKPVHCPLILQTISTTFIASLHSYRRAQSQHILKQEAVFILLFITCTEYIFSVKNGKRTLILTNIQDLLQSLRSEIVNIFARNIMPLPSSVSRYIRERKDLIYNYKTKLNMIEIFGKTPIFQQPRASQRSGILHTFCRIIKRKIPQIRENTTNKQNVSKIWCSKKNEMQREMTIDKVTMNEICNDVKSFTPASRNNNIIKENLTSVLSEWSNWTYPDNNLCSSKKMQTVLEKNKFDSNFLKFYKRFDFLPQKLHKLLRGTVKLTKTDILSGTDRSILSVKLKCGLQNTLFHEEMNIRACKSVQRFREFKLKKELLKSVKVLGQVNNELIVGLIIENNVKVLVLMDQHAVHERIRYEDLLRKYKSQTANQLLSIKLKNPIIVDLPIDNCNLLLSYQIQLKKFGISLSTIKDNTLAVHTVPECLKKNKYHCNEMKLKLNVQNLLNELLRSIIRNQHLQINDLPLTIHNAIATEACHGAIKFGDPLTLQHCRWLLKLLNETKIPTRCAHGRPSIIPILELSELKKRQRKLMQEKLNFAALKLYSNRMN